jgi:hypothetical protein
MGKAKQYLRMSLAVFVLAVAVGLQVLYVSSNGAVLPGGG